MSIRLRVILIISLTNLVIIIFSMCAGMMFMRRNINESQEADMQIVADIADNFISNEIALLFLRASSYAKDLVLADESEWDDIIADIRKSHPEYIGFAVFDVENGRIAALGDCPAPEDALHTTHIAQALEGKKTLNTSYPYEDGSVFYVSVPFPKTDNMILTFTIPGLFFHEKLVDFVIWETGHVYMIDPEGTIVSNPRGHWVTERWNIPEMAIEDPGFESLAITAARMASGESGIGYYTVYGVPRVCAFRPVIGSEDGWSLGTVAPIPESPFRDINTGLLVIGSIGFALGVVAAVVAASYIKKPFEKIEALQAESELNSQYKSQFLANMSHEMRTPLTSVIGLTELTLRTVHLDNETHGNLVKVYRAGETLLGLINDILDISKIEANKFELHENEYDLPSIINDAVTQSLLYIGEKPIKFVLDITEDLPLCLYGDDLRVKQIFNNLLSNAFKFTKEGTVELYVRCEKDAEGMIMTARVSDTGIGIKKEDFGKLFTLYANMNEENKIQDSTRRTEGTGLGLSICKRISEMMHGSITVESEYGKGSVFTAKLRQGYVDDTVIGTDVVESLKNFHYSIDKFKNVEQSRLNLEYARVLVVDDNTANLDVAKGLMSLYGMKIDCVTGGRQAIDAIRDRNRVYNAVFMDHMMPGIDGIEATQMIRALDTDYAREIPIIALTANAIIGNEEMFLQKGFQAFLAKPIDMTELDTVLRKWVRDKDKESELADDDEHIASHAVTALNDVDISIPGINAESMKNRYKNNSAVYLPILRSTLDNLIRLEGRLQNVTEDSIKDYCIDVHGLKSVAANISADNVSKMAAELEAMCRNGKIADISEKNRALLSQLHTLTEDLKIWLDTNAASDSKQKLHAPDSALLERLRVSCEAFDIESADNIMEELESVDYETGGELVIWLREKLTDSQFTEISERLSVSGV